tara:strand:- start:373 stop:831 length:459 start_codon:yes stop_codon:yes gene_type:complete
MATVTYKGDRSYVEYTSSIDGVTYGWTRQRRVENIPEDLAAKFRADKSNYWLVEDDSVSKTEAMKEVIEAPVVEEVVVEEPVVEEAPVEEAPVEEAEAEDAEPFDPNWTRGEMIKWFSARGITTPRTATKASLTARAEALLNPAAEGSEGDE